MPHLPRKTAKRAELEAKRARDKEAEERIRKERDEAEKLALIEHEQAERQVLRLQKAQRDEETLALKPIRERYASAIQGAIRVRDRAEAKIRAIRYAKVFDN